MIRRAFLTMLFAVFPFRRRGAAEVPARTVSLVRDLYGNVSVAWIEGGAWKVVRFGTEYTRAGEYAARIIKGDMV